MSKRWVALFSQTGSEINDISKRIGRYPDLCITNRSRMVLLQQQTTGVINSELYNCSCLLDSPNQPPVGGNFRNKTSIIFTGSIANPTISQYLAYIGHNDDTIVTLHGWLRIVPPEVCKVYEMYNGHPGLITKYPELKGRDPQKRAWLGKYQTAGTVIHRVTPGVDEGPVLLQNEIDISGCRSEAEVFTELKTASLELWTTFFYERGLNTI